MATKPPTKDIDESRVRVGKPQRHAVGAPAVAHALEMSWEQMGAVRSARALLRVNQKDGFDCPGCAWPETDKRHVAEFCENGAKAVAEEATLRRVGLEFFAAHSIDELAGHDDWWLGQQGRLTHPMVLEAGATHYTPLDWDDALARIAAALRAADPDEAVFYTSGRTSNEAAFLYQLMARGLGTNNLPDCSNMCHESSGSALTETLGIGKGTVTIEDIHTAELLIVAGQNPGTNHPRMLTALEKAKQNGARIIAVNPLPEAGLVRFENPQTVKGMLLGGTRIADDFVQIRLGGDQALFQAIGKHLLEHDTRRINPPLSEKSARIVPTSGDSSDGVGVDHAFVAQYTSGFEAYRDAMADVAWSELESATGIREEDLRHVGEAVRQSGSTIVCWAMGLTQHKHSVATLRDIVNVLLLQGNVGRPGAGVCPVRGHSNVQGDRTMGIYEKPSETFLAALDREFGFTAPREHGHDTVDAIRAMRDGRARVFVGMGGNFVAATPDTAVVEQAMRRVGLSVQVSTKLNRSHVVTGRTAIILPTLGRTDRDRRGRVDQRGGVDQRVTVEDSMGAVHASHGRLEAPADDLRSEVQILARLCELLFGETAPGRRPSTGSGTGGDDGERASGVEVDAGQAERMPGAEASGPSTGSGTSAAHLHHPANVPHADWAALADDYALIRGHIAKVVPGFEDFDARIAKGRTLMLPNGPRDDRQFATVGGTARFTVNALEYPVIPPGRLLLQTLRSHDQYNTTIYGKDDRYRGIRGGRRVVLVNAYDIRGAGFADGDVVDLVSEWRRPDGEVEERRADGYRIVAYPTPVGNAAAYYPETNVLVPLDSTADVSGTPTSKSVIIRLERRAQP